MKKLRIGTTEQFCLVQKYKNSKKLSLSVRDDGLVRMSIPSWSTYGQARHFLKQKEGWVLGQLERLQNQGAQSMLALGTRDDYLQNREKARQFVQSRVEHFNAVYCFDYGRISIRNQRLRWGSCSANGNLNFNWRIIYLTGEQADYLIAHELCHLKHLDHSKDFWQCIGRTIPNYRQISKQLRRL